VTAATALIRDLTRLGSKQRAEVLAEIPLMHLCELDAALRYDWRSWAREKQLPPKGDWRFWLILAGRGFGKTRTGAEWIRSLAESGRHQWLTIVGPTRESVFKVMLKGPAGILNISPPWFYPKHIPSRTLLVYPNGVQVRYYSAERPERLRGEQHEAVWMDEVAAWPHPEAFEQIDMGLRLGPHPRGLITTTPKPSPLIIDLALGPKNREGARTPRPDVVVAKGSSEENADNLARGSIESMRARYGDSRLGRQELDAELLEKTGKELWSDVLIRDLRVPGVPCPLRQIVVAVDPTRAEDPGDECGIIAAGLGVDGHGYVLEDASMRGSPHAWARTAIECYRKLRADRLVYEKNRLGAEIEATIRAIDPSVKWEGVAASDGKHTRAAPVSALYEQGKVHHVGDHPILEDEMTTWDPETSASPNRMDALVWAITALMLGEVRPPLVAM
jgi:phage terminase large subunit-like protein